MHDRRSASSNQFNTRTKVQELGKDQESTPGWINTVTSEDFRRKVICRPKTVNLSSVFYFKNCKKYFHVNIRDKLIYNVWFILGSTNNRVVLFYLYNYAVIQRRNKMDFI